MAASAMVAVGSMEVIIQKICEQAKKIIPGKNLGSVISKEAKERIERYITEAEKAGAFAGISLTRDASGATADVCIADRVTGKRTQRRRRISMTSTGGSGRTASCVIRKV